jgi:hypothetical protein
MLALRDPVLVGRMVATLDVLERPARHGDRARVNEDEYRSRTASGRLAAGAEHDHRCGRCSPTRSRVRRVLRLRPDRVPAEAGPAAKAPDPHRRRRPPLSARPRSATVGGDPANIPEIRHELADAGRTDDRSSSRRSRSGPVPSISSCSGRAGVLRRGPPWLGRVGDVGREGLAVVEQYAKEIGLSA